MEQRAVPVAGHLDLARTLRPLPGQQNSDGWWYPARTPVGPGTLRVRRQGDDVIGEAWGGGAGWLLERIDAITGLTDDPSSFRTEHPLVDKLHRRNPGYRFGRTGLVFDALLRAVCFQRVTNQEGRSSLRQLSHLYSDPAPGSNRSLQLPPDPERLAVTPYWELHRLGLERRRAQVIQRLAAEHHRLERLGEQPVERASQLLLSLNGVGEWSVAKTLAISHGDPDQVPVGDFHIPHIVTHHLTGKARGSDEEMLELLEPFRPHRGRVIRLLTMLGAEPKFGPRVPVHNIKHH